MSRKSKRTKGIEEARPFAGMSRVNEDAAGVDIGAIEINEMVVAVSMVADRARVADSLGIVVGADGVAAAVPHVPVGTIDQPLAGAPQAEDLFLRATR